MNGPSQGDDNLCWPSDFWIRRSTKSPSRKMRGGSSCCGNDAASVDILPIWTKPAGKLLLSDRCRLLKLPWLQPRCRGHGEVSCNTLDFGTFFFRKLFGFISGFAIGFAFDHLVGLET